AHPPPPPLPEQHVGARLRPFPAWPRPLSPELGRLRGCHRRSAAFAPRVPPACGSPPRLSFAEVTRRTWSRYPVGFGLSYSCRPGYTLASGKSPVVIWSPNSVTGSLLTTGFHEHFLNPV
uniref:Sushi domain-containing protein n=1 Tax=Terrapene triunguis TaxID=2587831 RepID=A0A674JU95_9SAUR